MAEMKESRRQYITIAAIDPTDGTACEVMISYDRMQAVGRRSLGHAKECAYVVPMILQHPTAVFEGFGRDEDEDRTGYGWRCYCGIPDHAYLRDGSAIPPHSGQVYLVFVNDEGVAYNWRWEEADSEQPLLPVDYADRFREQVP